MHSSNKAGEDGGARERAATTPTLLVSLAMSAFLTLCIPPWHAVLAQTADPPAQAAAPPAQPAASLAETKPPTASEGDIDGETMFATSCGFCHEAGGRAPGKGPKLAGTKRTDDYLINRIKTGKPGAMPAFGYAFSEGQIMAILAYIRGLEE